MALAAVTATRASTASSSISFSVSATAGNALIAGGSAWGGSTWTVTRTGDTYTQDTTGANGNARTGISSAPNVVAGPVNMAASSSGAGAVAAFALEVSGTPSSSIRDATSPAVGTGTSSSPASNSLTNATADAIYVTSVAQDTTASPGTVTPGGGWADTVGGTTMSELDGNGLILAGMAYQIVASAAGRTASWTVGLSDPWSVGVAVYKASGAAAAAPIKRLTLLGVG